MYKMFAVLGLAKIKSSQITCKSTNVYYMSGMIIFVATSATILLLAKLGAKPKKQLKRVKVKAKKDNR